MDMDKKTRFEPGGTAWVEADETTNSTGSFYSVDNNNDDLDATTNADTGETITSLSAVLNPEANSFEPIMLRNRRASSAAAVAAASQPAQTKPRPTKTAIPVLYKWDTFLERHAQIVETDADVWICEDNLRAAEVFVRIPMAYDREARQGRAVFAYNFPSSWQNAAVKPLFSSFNVEKVPIIIDTISREVFRWVILATFEDAQAAIQRIDGMIVHGNQIRVCQAWIPGHGYLFDENFTMDYFCKWGVRDPMGLEEEGPIQTRPIPSPIPIPIPIQNPPTSTPVPTPTTLAVRTTSPIATPTSMPTAESIHSHPLPVTPKPVRQPGIIHVPGLIRRPVPVTPEANINRREASLATDQDHPATGFVSQVATWANIAQMMGGESRTIDLHPENRPIAAPRLRPVGRIPSVSSSRSEPQREQSRLVFLMELPQNITLEDISDAIKEGPLHSIRFGVDEDNGKRYAGVIFQHARDAEIFVQVLIKERNDNSPSRFRFVFGNDSVIRHSFPSDDYINMMCAPTWATRRLTIVKSRFFFVFGKRDFDRLCTKVGVPADQIQKFWVYNGGNATAIFADVKSAVVIKAELERISEAAKDENNHFHGLQVSYSKDPTICEVNYVTDMTI